MNNQKVWFITGASTGFGRELAEEVLAQGHKVVATARKPETVADLAEKFAGQAVAVRLDVTKPEEVRAAIATAVNEFGRIDVLVNNAGYGSLGAVEEFTDEQIRRQFDTNFFGAVDVIRAALPQMREQKSGHILNISSVGGFVSFPTFGFYCATKFALEAVSESLARELEGFGIKITIVEPGAFRTKFGGSAIAVAENRIADYEVTDQFLGWMKEIDGNQPGEPLKAVRAMIKIVESEKPPLRLPLGEDAIQMIQQKLEAIKNDTAPWRELGINTAFEGMKAGAIGG